MVHVWCWPLSCQTKMIIYVVCTSLFIYQQGGLIEGAIIMSLVGAIRFVYYTVRTRSTKYIVHYCYVCDHLSMYWYACAIPYAFLFDLSSIKGMLLLIDCKDRILLKSSYSALRSASRNGEKKSEIVSVLLSIDTCALARLWTKSSNQILIRLMLSWITRTISCPKMSLMYIVS